jgi:RNA 2',3'-cyclic 3'-phosphodiesterase
MFSSSLAVRIMPARPYLPGFQPNPELDLLFFALRVGAENATRVVQLCDCLCRQNGLRGRRIAADLLHITLRGVGAYDGLPHFIVERACEAGATVSTSPFPLMFDRAMSFNSGRGKRPLVLCPTSDLAGLFRLHVVLGEAMKRARVGRHLRSHFTPHITLLYDSRVVRELAIEPILMNVRDFVLVHSIVGQHKHIELARWPLRG